ncbi:MAG: aspartyl protease family protein [Pyrinomonadaceae bacterium]
MTDFNGQIFFFFLFFSLFGLATAHAGAAQTVDQKRPEPQQAGKGFSGQKPLATIPFDFDGNLIYLRVSVNDSEPLWFILDTGASASVISLDLMKRLKIDSAGEIPVGGAGNGGATGHLLKGASIKINGLEGFTSPVQVAVPLAHLEPFSGRKLEGVLGYEFFSQFAVDIDYQAKKLTVYDGDGLDYRGKGQIIPIIFKRNHPHIKAKTIVRGPDRAEEIETDFVIDTGSSQSVALTRQFVDENKLLEKISPTLEVPLTGAGVGGTSKGLIGRIEKLRIGNFEIGRPITSLSRDEKGVFATSAEFEGNIGAEILKNFRVIFDYKNRRMILEKTSPAPFGEQKFDMSGILLKKSDGEIGIAGLIENSPAAESGLQKEDILRKINGRPASRYSLSELREKFKSAGKIELEIRRKGEVLKKILTLRKLI